MREPNFDFLKSRAKSLKKEKGIILTKAQDLVAQEVGYKDWQSLVHKFSSGVSNSQIEDFLGELMAHSWTTNRIMDHFKNYTYWMDDDELGQFIDRIVGTKSNKALVMTDCCC